MKHFNPALTARAVGTWRVHSITRHVYQRLVCERGSEVEFNKQPLIQLSLDADDGGATKEFVLQDFLYGTV